MNKFSLFLERRIKHLPQTTELLELLQFGEGRMEEFMEELQRACLVAVAPHVQRECEMWMRRREEEEGGRWVLGGGGWGRGRRNAEERMEVHRTSPWKHRDSKNKQNVTARTRAYSYLGMHSIPTLQSIPFSTTMLIGVNTRPTTAHYASFPSTHRSLQSHTTLHSSRSSQTTSHHLTPPP